MSNPRPPEWIVFDRAANFYDATRGFPEGQEAAVAELFARAGSLHASSCVLEVGIGTGRVALPLTRHVSTLYGVDLSRAMMNQLRSKAGAQSIRLSEANALHLPFRCAAFDAVVLVHVLHLVADWQAVLREIARVLKPEGLLLCGGASGDASNSPIFEPIWAAWRAALPESKIERIGLRQSVLEALPLLGWRPIGEAQQHTYSVLRSPHSLYQALANRHWSSTWQLSETELAHGLAAVQTAIQAHYAQPEQPIRLEIVFNVQAFQPPQQSEV